MINKEVSEHQRPGPGPTRQGVQTWRGKCEAKMEEGLEESARARQPRGSLLMAPSSLPARLSRALGGSIPRRQTRRAQPRPAGSAGGESPCSRRTPRSPTAPGNKHPHLRSIRGAEKETSGRTPPFTCRKSPGKAKKPFPRCLLAWPIKQRKARRGVGHPEDHPFPWTRDAQARTPRGLEPVQLSH